MSEMSKVEEVARALCKQAGYGIGNDDWPVYVGAARAAIAALRVPTAAMLEAGNEQDRYDEGSAGAELHWQVMIDAALKE